jgi:hypothetical protein
MPFFTSLATSAYGPATNNGNGEAAHSPGTRLLLRCRVGRTSASRGSREGSHRSQLYSRRSEASYSEIVQMVGKLLGQRTNTRIGRPLVLRSAGRVSEWISKITGKEPRISAESAAIVCGSIICRSDKAMRELDYRPTSLETMFRDCIGWSPRTSSASRWFAARPCLPWVPRLLDGKWTNG